MNQDWANEWCSLGAAAEVAPGTMIHKNADRLGLALLNIEGEFYALEDRCAECGKALSGGSLINGELECGGCGLRLRVAGDEDPAAPRVPLMLVDDEIFAWIENPSDPAPT